MAIGNDPVGNEPVSGLLKKRNQLGIDFQGGHSITRSLSIEVARQRGSIDAKSFSL